MMDKSISVRKSVKASLHFHLTHRLMRFKKNMEGDSIPRQNKAASLDIGMKFDTSMCLMFLNRTSAIECCGYAPRS